MVIVFHSTAWSNIILLVLMIPQIRRNGHFYLIHYWGVSIIKLPIYIVPRIQDICVDVNVKTSHLFRLLPDLFLF